jgi:hypothetical protein
VTTDRQGSNNSPARKSKQFDQVISSGWTLYIECTAGGRRRQFQNSVQSASLLVVAAGVAPKALSSF